jgi:hypothetical protein
MYSGEYQLGQSVPLLLKTANASGTPTEPQDCPQVIVWRGSTDVFRGEMPIIERATFPGTFYFSLFLGPDYSAGNYLAEFRWVLANGYIGSSEATFRIVPGGHSDGAVVSQYLYRRPGTDFLVHQVERGALVPGKSPSI